MTNIPLQQNVVPFGFVDATMGTSINGSSNIAEAGTLTLEWSTLSYVVHLAQSPDFISQ